MNTYIYQLSIIVFISYTDGYLGPRCEDNSTCLELRKLTYCHGGRCLCIPGYIDLRGDSGCKESPGAKYLQLCKDNVECQKITKNSVCHVVCHCSAFTRYNKSSKSCEFKRPMTAYGPCKKSSDCMKDLECERKRCQCNGIFISNRSISESNCVTAAEWRKPCSNKRPCPLPKISYCSEGRCLCTETVLLSPSLHNFCRRDDRKPLGERCEMNRQCIKATKHSACIDNKCQCPFPWKIISSFGHKSCGREVTIGSSCTDDDKCIDINSECRFGMCLCKYSEDGNLCKKPETISSLQIASYALGTLLLLLLTLTITWIINKRCKKPEAAQEGRDNFDDLNISVLTNMNQNTQILTPSAPPMQSDNAVAGPSRPNTKPPLSPSPFYLQP